VVEFGFGSGTFWQAQAGHSLVFAIQQIANNELHGSFMIGNLTLPANDSRIAAELALSIWPWFPGLVSHLDWNIVDQEANDAANSFYMNGSLDIRSTATTRSYIYHQGPWGNQNTTLVYDVNSGILLSGYTEFFFLHNYHLGIEFTSLTQKPTSLTTFLFIGTLGIAVIVLIFGFLIYRSRSRKEILVKDGKGGFVTPKNGMAIRVALIAVLAAMAIGGNYALSAIPNVELSSVMVFLSGFLFGAFIGAIVGFISMSIYQLWNPWGAFIPPIGIAVIGCTIVIGIVGGIIGRALNRLTYSDNRWFLLPSLFGILLTCFFDLVTTFAYSVGFGIPFIVALVTGLPFMVIHSISNAILFSLLTQPVTRAIDYLKVTPFQHHADKIKAKKKINSHEL
jgi:hypothetical protein